MSDDLDNETPSQVAEAARILSQISQDNRYKPSAASRQQGNSEPTVSTGPLPELQPRLRAWPMWRSKHEDAIKAALNPKQTQSFLVTGPSGSGKTTLLKNIQQHLRVRYKHTGSRPTVQVLAPTAVAAIQCGGRTLHSFFGLQECYGPEAGTYKVTRHRQSRWELKNVCVILIDEISRVEAKLWDKMEELARTARGSSRPFGGIQVICFGDFYQLPPVTKATRKVYAFQSSSWKKVITSTITLREAIDFHPRAFAVALQEARIGSLSDHSIAYLRTLARPLPHHEQVPVVDLFARGEDARRFNDSCLQELPGPALTFEAGDTVRDCSKEVETDFFKRCPSPSVLQLRINTRVALTARGNPLLPAGSVGIVIGAATYKIWKHLEVLCEQERDRPKLIRVGTGVNTPGLDGDRMTWPIVHFPDRGRRVYALIALHKWSLGDNKIGKPYISRLQLPLILAWAMTIHRAQGLLIPAVRAHLSGSFEDGQAYVALSRTWSADNLQLIDFQPSQFKVAREALQFYGQDVESEEEFVEDDEDVEMV